MSCFVLFCLFFQNTQAQTLEDGWISCLLCSLEPTHLNGSPREGPVHIIADNEVAIHDCVLLLGRLLLLGDRRLESDVSLEK